jgi:hypothetical protein
MEETESRRMATSRTARTALPDGRPGPRLRT